MTMMADYDLTVEGQEEKISDKQYAINWAKALLQRSDLRFLDTETTGLRKAYLVEISILSRYGSTMLDTLVKPPVPIPPDVERIHGITNEMVTDAPEFPEIYPDLKRLLENKTVCIYNSSFDAAILNNCCKYYELDRLNYTPECAMLMYAEFYGEWSGYWENYKWQKLPGGSHRANGDAKACYELVRMMAAAIDKNLLFDPKPEALFPPIQLACEWEPWIEFAYRNLIHKDGYWGGRFRKFFTLSYPKFYWKNTKQVEILDDDIPW